MEIRISENQKKTWREFCDKESISLTELVIRSVERNPELRNRNLNTADKLEVMKFIENQNNIYSKVENNINQLARIVNGQRQILPSQLDLFFKLLEDIKELKNTQNNILKKLYELLKGL